MGWQFAGAVFLLAASGPSAAPECMAKPEFPAVQAVGRAAIDCVVAEARGMERSGERADIVAAASVSRCEERFMTYKAAIQRCGGFDLAQSVDRKARAQAEAEATEAVVSIRAGR